jgi:translation initiation factor IF-3
VRKFRLNERIIATNVRLILSDGTNQGQVTKAVALTMARNEGLDLIEVSDGIVPTCKIGDYGKMQYEKKKAEKHKNHAPDLKEIRINYGTDAHDIEIKRKKIDEFLVKGHKVIFAMIVKGRERYVTGNAAREKFNTMVREYFPTAKPNDIQENGKGFNITLFPA